MSVESKKALLARIKKEEDAYIEEHDFSPTIEKLSEELQTALKEEVMSVVLSLGLQDTKSFLDAF